MRHDAAFTRLDPVDLSQVERASTESVFDELLQSIVSSPRDASESSGDAVIPLRLRGRSNHRRPAAAGAAAAIVVLVVGLVTFDGGGGGPNHRVTAPWHAAHPLSSPSRGAAHSNRAGTWQLLDDVLSGRWQQNTSGPPPGYLTCPTASTCYAMSGRYPSALAGTRLLSESLYVSTDVGATWSVVPMPHGFVPTSPIACGGASECAAGGTVDGHSVFVATTNGGHSFTISQLPSGVGSLTTLDCPSIDFCAGLAAPNPYVSTTHTDATFLSTSDGGASFADSPIIAGESMEALTCSSSLDCTSVGTSDASGVDDWTAGVAVRTTTGGRTWAPGTLPAGFGISQYSKLACADALHCAVTGNIDITVQNPPQCASIQLPASGATTTTIPTTQRAALGAIAQVESRTATAANLNAASSSGSYTCSSNGQHLIGDISSTVNGGRSWTPDPLPIDAPQPMFSGVSCPTDKECWATGSDAVPQQVGNVHNGGSSMLLGTTDGGSTWSSVTFSTPAGAPDYDGQSYLSLGFITCPTSDVCVADGAAAQGSPSAPIYSLTQRGQGV